VIQGKAGMEYLVRVAAKAYTKRGINFNAIIPGNVLAGVHMPLSVEIKWSQYAIARSGRPAVTCCLLPAWCQKLSPHLSAAIVLYLNRLELSIMLTARSRFSLNEQCCQTILSGESVRGDICAHTQAAQYWPTTAARS